MVQKPKKKRSTKATYEKRGVQDADKEVGRRIRLTRVDRNISQMELGEALGISFQQIQKYEKGVNRIGAARLMQVATELKTTPHELMGWLDSNNTAMIDIETYKLAKAFSGLKSEWKRPIRSLIGTLMEGDDAE